MAIDIAFTADTSKVVKGTKDIGDALERVSDDLTGIGKDAKDLDAKVSDAFQDMGKEGEKAGEKLDESLSDTFRKMGQDAKRAGDDVGRGVKDGTDRATRATEDFRDETRANLSESVSSFRGDVEDIPQLVQDVLGGVSTELGAFGGVFAIAAAAGIGLTIAALQGQADKIAENKDRMLDLAQTIKDNGGVLTESDYISQMEEYGYAIQDTKEWWELFQADAVSGFEQLRDLAKETGMSTRDIFRGGFGDREEAQQTLDEVNKRLGELKDRKEAVYNLQGTMLSVPENEELDSLERTKTLIEDNIQAQKDAEMVDRIRRGGVDSLTDSITDNREALRNAAEHQKAAAENEAELAKYVQGTAEHYRAQADAIEESTDALKGSITTELDYLDAKDELTEKLKDSGNAWDINTAKGRENQRAVVDIASGIEEMAKAALDSGAPVADVTAKFEDQKRVLVDQVLPAFQGNRDAAQQYIDKILAIPPVTKTRVELDKEEAERRLRELTSPKGIPMHVTVDGSAVENYFISQQGRKIFVDVAPRGGGQAIALP